MGLRQKISVRGSSIDPPAGRLYREQRCHSWKKKAGPAPSTPRKTGHWRKALPLNLTERNSPVNMIIMLHPVTIDIRPKETEVLFSWGAKDSPRNALWATTTSRKLTFLQGQKRKHRFNRVHLTTRPARRSSSTTKKGEEQN